MAARFRSEQSTPAVVIDQGSGFCKVGLAGDRAPRSVLHTVVARDGDQVKVLEEAWGSRGTLPVEWPIQRGTVSDWDAMEKVYMAFLLAEVAYVFYGKRYLSPMF